MKSANELSKTVRLLPSRRGIPLALAHRRPALPASKRPRDGRVCQRPAPRISQPRAVGVINEVIDRDLTLFAFEFVS